MSSCRLVGFRLPCLRLRNTPALASTTPSLTPNTNTTTDSFGPNFLVELEVVLPPDMPVRESHDIALALQQKVRRQAGGHVYIHI